LDNKDWLASKKLKAIPPKEPKVDLKEAAKDWLYYKKLKNK